MEGPEPARPLTDTPLPPDEGGYCYWNRRDFESKLSQFSASLVVGRLIFGRFTGLLWWGVGIIAYTLLAWQAGFWFIVPGWSLILLAYGIWIVHRGRRHKRRMIADMLCFQCGYSLRGAPTDNAGWGRCPECARKFNVAYYRAPPRDYVRMTPVRPIEEMLHPLDIARMERRNH